MLINLGKKTTRKTGVNFTFEWEGRRLTGATYGGNTYSFVYNDEGIRTSKTKNGVTTTYYVSGSRILAEETNGNTTLYNLFDWTGRNVYIGWQDFNILV